MPYNSSAIPPSEEVTGAALLPLARVKKILNVDEDLGGVSANAAFAITIATEMFVRYLADQGMNVIKSEKKPRRQIQYRDLANAVSRVDNLSFLEDIVPRTTTVREFKNRKARAAAQESTSNLQNGQTTLDGPSRLPVQTNQTDAGAAPLQPMDIVAAETGRPAPPQHHPVQQHTPTANGQTLVFEHYEPNGNAHRDESGDVQMN